ncbi:UNVERIFIED_CONTAM: Eukaryotic translation initiation factor 4G [Sesamum latifolium]|uniref:Eukaryotic translation initiation factor 4G n=1 Tax=Sesamum latifolium TaxID=2727402 RepID=A0AAW2U1R4_9LAMI
METLIPHSPIQDLCPTINQGVSLHSTGKPVDPISKHSSRAACPLRAVVAPPPPSSQASRSFKKYNNNAQGGQSRARSPNVDLDSGTHAANQQQPTHRAALSNISAAAPISDVPVASSESGTPATHGKGDASKSFPLQFGSISPGFMKGVQIPARTSSAPPNLDEQKKAQARQNSVRLNQAAAIPKPHSLKNDTGILDQTNTVEAQPVSKSKRDTQVSAGAPVTQTQKPAVHHIPGMPMQLPFHQPQVPVQIGGPNPQIQSQAMSGSSLPLPMQIPLPIANPPMQQPMFISAQMGHQLPPQLGSMGINMAPQFHQQQSHLNVPPQSPPIPSFPPNHLMNFNPNSYNAPPIFFPAASSVPMIALQVPPTSQPPRFYNKVTVKPPVGSHGEKESLPAAYSISVGKTKSLEVDNSSLSALPESKSRLGTSIYICPITRNGVLVPDSTKDKHNKPVNRGQHQVNRYPESLSSLPSQLSEAEGMKPESTLSRTDLVPATSKESVPTTAGTASEASNLASEDAKEGKTGDTYRSLGMKGVNSRQPEPEIIGRKEQGEDVSPESSKFDKNSLEKPMQSLSLESPQITGKESSNQEVTPSIGGLSEHAEGKAKETLGCRSDDLKMTDNLVASTHAEGGGDALSSVSVKGLSAQDDKISSSDTSQGVRDGMGTTVAKSVVDQESAPVLVPSHPHGASIPENADIGNNGGDLVSPSTTVNDKVLSDTNAAKSVVPRGKKKKKNYIEKQKLLLETSKNTKGIDGDGNGLITKRYSRDFLLKFVEQCTDLPEGLEITSDIADVLMISSVNIMRESYPIHGRNSDRAVAGSRPDRRAGGLGDEDKWSKFPGPLMQGEEICGQMLAMWVTLSAIDLAKEIFDKALMEPTFCEMYADFCFHLAADLPDLSVENEKITFKRLLLNKCQEEFERGEKEKKRQIKLRKKVKLNRQQKRERRRDSEPEDGC